MEWTQRWNFYYSQTREELWEISNDMLLCLAVKWLNLRDSYHYFEQRSSCATKIHISMEFFLKPFVLIFNTRSWFIRDFMQRIVRFFFWWLLIFFLLSNSVIAVVLVGWIPNNYSWIFFNILAKILTFFVFISNSVICPRSIPRSFFFSAQHLIQIFLISCRTQIEIFFFLSLFIRWT